MKRFIISVLSVSVFFVGLGALVQKAGASFKSDEKALELVRKARTAIGGDNAIANVKSLRIAGRTTKTISFGGTARSESGDTEIAMQLPDKLMKMTKLGNADGNDATVMKQMDVIVVSDAKDTMKVSENGGDPAAAKKIIIKKDDGTVTELTGAEAEKVVPADGGQNGDNVKTIILKRADGSVQEIKEKDNHKTFVVTSDGGQTGEFTTKDGDKIFVRKADGANDNNVVFHRQMADTHHDGMRQNELLRLTLGLLLTAPQGMDISYTYGGESDVDGTACNIVVAEFAGTSYKIYLGKSSNLPVMMSYTAHKMPQVMAFTTEDDKNVDQGNRKVAVTRTIAVPAAETAEFNVKFSDYRSVGGIQLPFKWTQTIGGDQDETFDVSNYEINPENIADKFKDQKVMVRTFKSEKQ